MTFIKFSLPVPPVFLNDDSTSTATVLVRENQNLTLTCRAQGFPTPKIAWKREDGMDIVLNRKHKGNRAELLKYCSSRFLPKILATVYRFN